MSHEPWLDDGDVVLHHGDALEQLALMPSESVQCIVTSPPFYSLRDYNHEGQIGLEASPEAWAQRLVDVFREARRVLRTDGCMWLECGDTYAANRPYQVTDNKHTSVGNEGAMTVPDGMKPKDLMGCPWLLAFALRADGWYLRSDTIWARPNPMPESVTDRPTKAHSYVFLLTKSARYFYDADAIREPQQDIARRGSPRSHSATDTIGRNEAGVGKPKWNREHYEASGRNARSVWSDLSEAPRAVFGTRDMRDGIAAAASVIGDEEIAMACEAFVAAWDEAAPSETVTTVERGTTWSIPTEPTPFAHFATFPQALVERCVKAGTSEHGACGECGAPWRRITETRPDDRKPYATEGAGEWANGAGRNDGKGARKVLREDGRGGDLATVQRAHVGWEPTCAHDSPVVPCVVLDCFSGSGTTALVARRLGRHAWGIELNASYLRIAAERLQQPTLWSNPT